MSMQDKNEILLGAGELYLYEFNESTLPSDEVIETETHNVGHTQGGASIDYKPTKYDVENSYGKIVKSFITKEEITFKSGLLTWIMDNIALLSCAVVSVDPVSKQRTLTFGGGGQSLKNVLVRFVHTKANGKKVRFTMIGQGGNGFTIEFNDKEVVVDAEITAIEHIKNFLASFTEELTNEEYDALYPPSAPLTLNSAAGTETGTTAITITEAKGEGNKYLYKVLDTEPTETEVPRKDDIIKGYTSWDGTADLAIENSKYIIIVEVNASNKAVAAGYTQVVSKLD